MHFLDFKKKEKERIAEVYQLLNEAKFEGKKGYLLKKSWSRVGGEVKH